MSFAAKRLINQNDHDATEVIVSVNGTWQKRYGHNSMLGATFVISMDNGCVLDYSIKYKIYHACKKNPHPTNGSRNIKIHVKLTTVEVQGVWRRKGPSKCLCVQ